MQWLEREVEGTLVFKFPKSAGEIGANPTILIGGITSFFATVAEEGNNWVYTATGVLPDTTQSALAFLTAACRAGSGGSATLYSESIAVFRTGRVFVIRMGETMRMEYEAPVPASETQSVVSTVRHWEFTPPNSYGALDAININQIRNQNSMTMWMDFDPEDRGFVEGEYRIQFRWIVGSTAATASYEPLLILPADAPPDPLSVTMAGPSTGMVGNSLNFGASSNGPAASFAWSFGDGWTSTQQNPTHVFTHAGTYTVTVTARNAADETASDSLWITISDIPKPPLTVTIAGPSNGMVGEDLQFTATGNGENLTYAWNFGDGATASGATVTHVYQRTGIHALRVTATDDQNRTATASRLITIVGKPVPPDPPGLRSAPCFFESAGEFSGVPGSPMGQILHAESASLKATVADGLRTGDEVIIRELIAPDTPTWSRRYRVRQIIPDGAMTTLILQRSE